MNEKLSAHFPLRQSKKFSLALFNQELISLLDAGLSIVIAIETLADKEKRIEFKLILNRLVKSLHEGKSLSVALGGGGKDFPRLYIATIRASERTGNLVESLKRYLAYQRQVDEIKKKVISASIYPALLLTVGSLVILFLMTYVVPKFSHIYTDTGRELPLASKLLILWGNFIEGHGASIFVGSVIVIGFCGYGLSTRYFKSMFREWLWKFPMVGEQMKIYQLTHFYRTLGMLSNAGIPIVNALEQVVDLLDIRMQKKLTASIRLVKDGLPLSTGLERNDLTTSIASRLLKVGEETGQIGLMLDKIADFHEEEFSRWVDIATKLLEPVLMTFMGILIGGIVVLMYIPIFELAGSIQ